jgi:dolichol-phosphate mannosyltransferase
MTVLSNTAAGTPARAGWQVPDFDTVFWQGATRGYCLVIPVINEGARIRNLLTRMKALGIARHCDILVADGGSNDGSLAPDWLRAHDVRALLLKRGPGKLSAQLRCAYAFALDQGYTGIVTIDGNDKDDPEAIPRFIEALEAGYDFVQASRFIAGGQARNTPRSRDLAIRFVHAPMLRLFSGFRWTDTTQGFRAYSRTMLLDPRIAPFRDVFAGYELLAYLSLRAPQLAFRCIELAATRIYPEGEVPTKISAIRGNLSVLAILVKACLGRYNVGKR